MATGALQIARRVVPARGRGDDVAEVFETPAGSLLVVADGAGGRSGAWEAAHTAAERVRAATVSRPSFTSADLVQILESLDQELQRVGETTAVLAFAGDSKIDGASVGDSGAWMIHPSAMIHLTSGQHRLRAGSGAAQPTPFTVPSQSGTLLIATDGLLKYASPEVICNIARGRDLEVAADALVSTVRLRSGALQDDVGFLLVRKL